MNIKCDIILCQSSSQLQSTNFGSQGAHEEIRNQGSLTESCNPNSTGKEGDSHVNLFQCLITPKWQMP